MCSCESSTPLEEADDVVNVLGGASEELVWLEVTLDLLLLILLLLLVPASHSWLLLLNWSHSRMRSMLLTLVDDYGSLVVAWLLLVHHAWLSLVHHAWLLLIALLAWLHLLLHWPHSRVLARLLHHLVR